MHLFFQFSRHIPSPVFLRFPLHFVPTTSRNLYPQLSSEQSVGFCSCQTEFSFHFVKYTRPSFLLQHSLLCSFTLAAGIEIFPRLMLLFPSLVAIRISGSVLLSLAPFPLFGIKLTGSQALFGHNFHTFLAHHQPWLSTFVTSLVPCDVPVKDDVTAIQLTDPRKSHTVHTSPILLPGSCR